MISWAATVLVATVLGFAGGWWYRGPSAIVAGLTGGTPHCDDRADGKPVVLDPRL